MHQEDERIACRRAIDALVARRDRLNIAIAELRELVGEEDARLDAPGEAIHTGLHDLSLRSAILATLHRFDRPVTNQELINELREGGFELDGPAPQVLISQTLRRLQEAGKVTRVERGYWRVGAPTQG